MKLAALFRRYGTISGSMALVSVAHLVVQLIAIRTLSNNGIGLVAFVITLIQLGFGLSNALVSVPYAILLNRSVMRRGNDVTALMSMNLLISVAFGIISCLLIWHWGAFASSIWFGIAIFFQLLRWFARSEALAVHQANRGSASDISYGLVLITCSLVTTRFGATLASVACCFAIASCLSFAVFGKRAILRYFPTRSSFSLIGYRDIWRDQASWALLGVITTEAAANGHIYLVTLFCGPTAFAPLAVGALFLRPLNVCIAALTQLERPALVRDIDAGNGDAAIDTTKRLTIALALVWVIVFIAAVVVLYFRPSLVSKSNLDERTVALAMVLSGLLALLQCVQSPLNILLQAANRFRPLAAASTIGCVITLSFVALILHILPPVLSLCGVIGGQVTMLIGMGATVRAWRAQSMRLAEPENV